MKRAWRIGGWTGLALLVLVGYATYRTVWAQPFTAVGIMDGTIFDHHSDKLAPYTVAQRDADYAQFTGFLKEVREFDRSRLDRRQIRLICSMRRSRRSSGRAARH